MYMVVTQHDDERVHAEDVTYGIKSVSPLALALTVGGGALAVAGFVAGAALEPVRLRGADAVKPFSAPRLSPGFVNFGSRADHTLRILRVLETEDQGAGAGGGGSRKDR